MFRRTTLIGTFAALVAGIAATEPAPASADIHISPALSCVTFNATSQTANYRLVGVNADQIIENIAVGDLNFFDPLPIDRNQPVQFIPGRTDWDVSVSTDPNPLSWNLNGHVLSLTRQASALAFQRPCPDRGPQITAVAPLQLSLGVQGQTLTVFGQGLDGASVTIGGAGVDAGTPTASTGNRLDVPVQFEAGAVAGARDLFVIAPNGDEVGCRGCLQVSDHPVASGQGTAGPQGAWHISARANGSGGYGVRAYATCLKG